MTYFNATHLGRALMLGFAVFAGGVCHAASWTTTAPLATAREYSTATLLPNGKVLVAGGVGGSYLASAEVYDPNNAAPTDIALAVTVNETTSVGTFSATNIDTADPGFVETFTYALATGTGDTDNAAFSIIGTTLKTATTFNFITKSIYSIRVRVTDSAGVYISGLGTDSNLVKGCWIGLSASGKAALPNLTGVLIDGGAKYNVIGSTVSKERNTISGNYFEGITMSGIGTDENIISGNILGAASKSDDENETSHSQVISRAEETLTIVNRHAVGNGSSGIFLSNGTKSTRVGGESNADGNLIAHNGDNGIEVRALASKRNTAKANIISRNGRGGIKLFDGSNENVGSPNFSLVTVGANATNQYILEGTVVGDGVVEIYSDTGVQGGTILGRTPTAGGKWTASVNLPTGEHLTATFTDGNGNTSPFGVFNGIITPTVPPVPPTDTDGDGVSDTLENLAGTDPNNASDTPTMNESIDCSTFGLKLDFKKKIGCIKASLGLILPKDFQTNGATVVLSCGAYSTGLLTLDTKGASPKAATSLKLNASKQGKLSASKLTLTLKDATLIAALDTLGFTNASTAKKGETVSLPLTLSLSVHSGTSITVYTLSVDVNYTATINVSGSGKKSGGGNK